MFVINILSLCFLLGQEEEEIPEDTRAPIIPFFFSLKN